MTFTKSFRYALRGVLYIAAHSHERPKMQVEEIASQLAIPKHFLGKIMKKLVKAGILNSTKGPHGGFSLNDRTLATSLLDLAIIMKSISKVDDCVLSLERCNSEHPCALHHKMSCYRKEFHHLIQSTTIEELFNEEKKHVALAVNLAKA